MQVNECSERSERNEHSRLFSPSSMARRISCLASAWMEDGLPHTSSPDAARGTYCHRICEVCILHQELTPADFLGREMYGIVCDEDMVAHCEVALAHAFGLITDDAEIAVEAKLSLKDFGLPECFGTADLVVSEPFGPLTVLDYKFGGVDVPVENNVQLLTYALMAGGAAVENYQAINICISQPKTSSRLKVWTITPVELLEWWDTILAPAISDINHKVMEYNPTESNCKYCLAAKHGTCAAYTQQALAVAQADFTGVMRQPSITPELVRSVYPQIPLLQQFIKQVEEMAFDLATAGELPGFKIVNGRSSRQWADEQAAVDLIEEAGHDAYDHKVISPAKAEKLSKNIKEAIQDLIIKTTGKPTIAPESDKRQAITVEATAAIDFQQFKEI
jgi:hypothetical protein